MTTTTIRDSSDNKFYVLSALNDVSYQPKVEYWIRNDPKKIRQIYKTEEWMHNKEHYMYLVEAGSNVMLPLQNGHRKVYNTDISDVHRCEKCNIFYLKKQACDTCKEETTRVE